MRFSFRKNKLAVTAFLLAVTMGLLFWFGMRPLQDSVWQRMNGIQKIYTDRENRERQVARLPDLTKQYEAIQADQGTLDILLSDDRIVDFVKTLEAFAADNHVGITITSKDNGAIVDRKANSPKTAVKSSDPSDTPASSTASKAPPALSDTLPFDRYVQLSLQLSGTYADTIAFLGRLETLPYGLDVIGVDVKSDDGDQGKAGRGTSGTNPFVVSQPASTEDVAPAVAPPARVKATYDMVLYLKKTN